MNLSCDEEENDEKKQQLSESDAIFSINTPAFICYSVNLDDLIFGFLNLDGLN